MKHFPSSLVLLALAALVPAFAHAQFNTYGSGGGSNGQAQAAFQAQMQRMQELQRQQAENWARMRAQNEALIQRQQQQSQANEAARQARQLQAQNAEAMQRQRTQEGWNKVSRSFGQLQQEVVAAGERQRQQTEANRIAREARETERADQEYQIQSNGSGDYQAENTDTSSSAISSAADQSASAANPAPQSWQSALTNSRLTAADLEHWSYSNLRKGINYLYARKGFPFESARSAPIRAVFMRESWYRPVSGMSMDEADQLMTEVEAENIKLMASLKSQMTPED